MYLDTERKIKIHMDTKEAIDRCLSCEKEKCDNCAGLIGSRRRLDMMRPVVQMDKNGVAIESFGSVNEAAFLTGADKRSIIRCCQGKQKTVKKFKWRYADAD